MNPLEAALQQLMSMFSNGGSGGALTPTQAGQLPSWLNPSQVASVSGGGMPDLNQLLQLILQGTQAGTASGYGSDQLNALKNIYALQQQAARMAMGVRPGQLGVQAVRQALPLNKALAYNVTSAADQANALRGMAQAPGATATAETEALAPYAQQNLQTGASLATDANQLAINRVQPAFQIGSPDYLSILDQLNTLGRNTTYGLPSGAGF